MVIVVGLRKGVFSFRESDLLFQGVSNPGFTMVVNGENCGGEHHGRAIFIPLLRFHIQPGTKGVQRNPKSFYNLPANQSSETVDKGKELSRYQSKDYRSGWNCD